MESVNEALSMLTALLIIWGDVVLRESRADRLNTWRNISTTIIWTGALSRRTLQMKTSSAWTTNHVIRLSWTGCKHRIHVPLYWSDEHKAAGMYYLSPATESEISFIRHDSEEHDERDLYLSECLQRLQIFLTADLLLKTGGFVPSVTHASS